MSKKASTEKLELVETKQSFAKAGAVEPDAEALDYSGAHAKTSPAEIKLVKKLDLWIMVGYFVLLKFPVVIDSL
jgi:hypothetical protein